ncbi:hypothetical protein PybrP1_008990 [[Pythium] brassicae (nom. inval.)]|nr:hypothetical protein PybrP1_008990 [[Pythium] brassicae (nom. inval.)]
MSGSQQQQQRRRKPREERHVVAELLETALATRQQQQNEDTTKFLVRNLVTRDEVDDPDERQELEDDSRAEFAAFGALVDLKVCGPSDGDEAVDADGSDDLDSKLSAGDVVVEFEESESAALAFAVYDSRVFGGRTVTCRWLSARALEADAHSAIVRVENMLAPDELEDDDEFEDVRDDIAGFFERHGAVQRLEICRKSGAISVEFQDRDSAHQVAAKMRRSVYGGRSPTESGLVEVVVSLLKRLASLQERAHQQNPLQSKRSRRFVLGLHEVRRGLLVNKIQLLLVATDVEECGVLDEKLAEIVAIAKREDVPLLFPMSSSAALSARTSV